MNKLSSLISIALISATAMTPVQANDKVKAYVFDSSSAVVKDGAGNCLRSTIGFAKNPLVECGDVPPDTDADGVADAQDQCPNTVTGAPVKTNGCEYDTDADGVVNSGDHCPSTAANTAVDANGCALDRDNDGVLNENDRCPETAAGATVNEFGCAADVDTDGDGIFDHQDACPGTAKHVAVDLRGCALKADIQLSNVQFKTGTAYLDTASKGILDRIAKVLVTNKHLKFEVAGHTDDRGSHKYNVALSKRRAASVRNYLVAKGVAAKRLDAEGYGPDHPLVNNDSAEGRAKNRRVELVLKK